MYGNVIKGDYVLYWSGISKEHNILNHTTVKQKMPASYIF